MTAKETFVIVGASLAGAKAAEALRTEGFDGRIVLLGEEAGRPFASIVRTHGPDCAIFDTDAECRAWCQSPGGGSLWGPSDTDVYLAENLVGTVEQVAESLREYEAAGVQRAMIQHLVHEDVEMVPLLGELARALGS